MYDPDTGTKLKILPEIMRNMESNLKHSLQRSSGMSLWKALRAEPGLTAVVR